MIACGLWNCNYDGVIYLQSEINETRIIMYLNLENVVLVTVKGHFGG